MYRRLRLTQVFALLATSLALAAFGILWFGPSGQSCTSVTTGSLSQSCTSTTAAGGMLPALLTALLVLSVAFAFIPTLFERRAWVQYSWAGVIVAFFILSFGLDMWFLPAACAAAACGASQPGKA